MKILFSADWHIKLNTKSIPNEWAVNRYNLLFTEIHKLESQVDMHIIGGDIFDRLPNMQELELFFKFVKACSVDTLIFSGNHEALKKNTTFLSYLKEVTNSINPLVQIIDSYWCIKQPHKNANLDIIPYNKLKEFADNPVDFHGNILFTHVRGEIPPHVKPEIDLSLFDRWKKVYAGDLHSNSNCQRNIFYPGSPLTTSFHRSEVETGIYIIDTDTLTEEWVKLDLPQLIRKTATVGEELIGDDYHCVVYEIEGDLSELHQVDSELVDKRITKRSTDTTLVLTQEMSITDELKEYLLYILELPDEKVDLIIKEYSDNIQNT